MLPAGLPSPPALFPPTFSLHQSHAVSLTHTWSCLFTCSGSCPVFFRDADETDLLAARIQSCPPACSRCFSAQRPAVSRLRPQPNTALAPLWPYFTGSLSWKVLSFYQSSSSFYHLLLGCRKQLLNLPLVLISPPVFLHSALWVYYIYILQPSFFQIVTHWRQVTKSIKWVKTSI